MLPTGLHVRRARRFWTLLSLIAVLTIVAVQPASAARGWCKTDPVITINGEIGDVLAAAPVDAPLLVTGPNKVVITVPAGVNAQFIASDLGFGRGWTVTIATSSALKVNKSGVQMEIKLYVPATDSTMPVRLEFAPRVLGLLSPAYAQGTANSWIVLRYTF